MGESIKDGGGWEEVEGKKDGKGEKRGKTRQEDKGRGVQDGGGDKRDTSLSKQGDKRMLRRKKGVKALAT